ncbi:hypothetical protein HG535_0E04540 [Zygotorulaspora mrakii]|uniref:Sulfiredoxin n=1 Tax=Zygotorulaspora mrakii TaxID=42260 RepID=A0A7H9B3Z9_ZYGMR|nr:uncharacterized protein HG535_0E04540 [Zygotorulaspora mrakii]QLG73370.1 hypothetical protein HG535_0E04540 [Zygotorulaspora mrakii]
MSIQTRSLGQIKEVPLSQIRRPIAPVLDYAKIDAMVNTMNGEPSASKTCTLEEAKELDGKLPPIDVMAVRENDQTYYFAFGGCHRFQAYERKALGSSDNDALVRCKVLPATRKQLQLYVGASVDTMFAAVDKANAASKD